MEMSQTSCNLDTSPVLVVPLFLDSNAPLKCHDKCTFILH